MEDERAQQLMLRCGQGDMAAFAELVEAYTSPVLRLIHRYLGSGAADAEDLAQDVFVRAFRARERYQPDAKFRTWLFRIATNRCLNHLRDTRGKRPLSLSGGAEDAPAMEVADPSARTADESLATTELQEAVRVAISRLPEAQRMATLLSRFEDMSHAEIAESMSLTEKAVKSLLFRARDNLRELLSPQLRRHDSSHLTASPPPIRKAAGRKPSAVKSHDSEDP